MVSEKKFRFNKKNILRNALRDLDNEFAEAVFDTYDGEYLKKRFTDHFFEESDSEYEEYKQLNKEKQS